MSDGDRSRVRDVLDCRPSLRAATARVWIDGDFAFWSEGRIPSAVDRFVGAVVSHLDALTTVRELAADLADAVSEPVADVEAHVARGLLEMARRGAIDGIDDEMWAPPQEEPGEVVVERLPDGRTLRTVTLEFSTANPAERDLVESLLAGDRSALDALPADSCVGQRLRIGSPADRLGTQVGDRTIAVRCNHEPTTAVLRASLRPLGPGEGMTVAVVTGPFEGSGPPRVYDASAQRVGRPRDGATAARVVGHLINELLPPPDIGPVAVSATAVVTADRAVLLPVELAEVPSLRRHLEGERLGTIPTRRVLLDEGGVTIEGVLGEPARRHRLLGLLVPDLADGLSPRTRALLQLARGSVSGSVQAPQLTFDRIAEVVTHASTVLRPLPEDPIATASVVSGLLRAP